MSGTVIHDLFATKGIEYLLAIGFLLTLVLFWRWLNQSTLQPATARALGSPWAQGNWFALPEGDYYHPGHGWARPSTASRVRVGMDDFAQKLLGRPDSIRLPELGAQVEQGGKGWDVQFENGSVPMLSPVAGTVVARNEALIEDPELINRDPQGEGWLLEIETPSLRSNLKNLLSGALARVWAESTERSLRQRISGDLGLVLQDGGVPVSGVARALDDEGWESIAREFLSTTDETD